MRGVEMITKKRGPEDMRRSRAKKRGEVAAILDNLLDDLDILRGPVVDGKRVITFDASPATWAGLEVFAQAQGQTLDQVLKGVIAKHLMEGAKLRKVKDKHEARKGK